MCGIAGFKISHAVSPQIINDMVGALIHRGPDSAGYYSAGSFTGGMRRLKINDLAGGEQPLCNEDKSVVLFYNGEIYNSPQLRNMLIGNGHSFSTRCDGEVICHLYEEEGTNVFEKLDGMFAVALWDAKLRRLILARDIPGEKPLYYTCLNEKELVYASEIKALIKFPGLDLSVNPQAIWDLPTFLWIPEPETIFTEIYALPRSHFLVADEKGITIHRYQNRFNRGAISLEDGDVIAETRKIVEQAVFSRLLSDVPVGSFLSSGLDSSIVATLAARALPSLHTFCIGFEDVSDPYHGRADESALAEEYARKIGTKHRTIAVTAKDFRNDLMIFCKYGDQPFAVSSGLGILSVARAARENGIKVLLSGDGADESFGGYSWYPYLDDHFDGDDVSAGVSAGKPVSMQNTALSAAEIRKILVGYAPAKRAWAWHYYADEKEKDELFNKEYFRGVKSSLRHFVSFAAANKGTWGPEDFIRQDRQFYFPYEMLRKVDRMTMAFSVEGRVPFAAPSVLSHADKLRFHHLVRDGSLKWVLRRAFADILPPEIVDRPKHGFNVPIDHWLKGDWSDLVEETFSLSSPLYKMGITDSKSRATAMKMIHDPVRLNGHTIFSFIILHMWLQQVDYGNNS
ncbi:MAG: asparagine synthase (glutamine-hydrolyzing) [Deltaproteobacteria bacterium]|nr:asparagine synthase (glutamine-hydrolyzing) [Deltaproteobacteria bacterium]